MGSGKFLMGVFLSMALVYFITIGFKHAKNYTGEINYIRKRDFPKHVEISGDINSLERDLRSYRSDLEDCREEEEKAGHTLQKCDEINKEYLATRNLKKDLIKKRTEETHTPLYVWTKSTWRAFYGNELTAEIREGIKKQESKLGKKVEDHFEKTKENIKERQDAERDRKERDEQWKEDNYFTTDDGTHYDPKRYGNVGRDN